ncbi:MAG: PA2169 family four-helix-bundle protein [Pseudomonadota bacterium]
MAREHSKDDDFNLDPISKEPGSHPVGTGLGAAAGGAALGAAAGVIAGPAGAVVGGLVGAVAGGIGGKEAGEAINPTAEEAYWRENYMREPYYEAGRTYEDYGPAYRLGMYGYNEYRGVFGETETQLARHWEERRERSTLSWEQARTASRAAWDRLGRRSSGTADEAVNDDVIDVLNDLLETSRNGEYGFRSSAEHAVAQDIKTLLNRRADDCREAAVELQSLIVRSGGKADEGGTISGALHRGWVSVKSALSGHTDKAILEECERGEDTALGQYRKALKQDLPALIRAVVERQAQGAQRNHDQVKALRDALRAGD